VERSGIEGPFVHAMALVQHGKIPRGVFFWYVISSLLGKTPFIFFFFPFSFFLFHFSFFFFPTSFSY